MPECGNGKIRMGLPSTHQFQMRLGIQRWTLQYSGRQQAILVCREYSRRFVLPGPENREMSVGPETIRRLPNGSGPLAGRGQSIAAERSLDLQSGRREKECRYRRNRSGERRNNLGIHISRSQSRNPDGRIDARRTAGFRDDGRRVGLFASRNR